MVRHVVFWKLKPEADGRSAEENGKLLAEKALSLLGQVPGLLDMEISFRILSTSGLEGDRIDVALMSTHEDAQALEVYATHPLHQPIIEWAGNIMASRHAVNYEL